MPILVIDTALEESFVALVTESSCLKRILIPSQNQGMHLLSAVDEILSQYNVSLKKLTAIGVNIGPGSFTGTRVGVMTAKALAYSSAKELIPYHSLVGYTGEKGPALIDARRGRCFTLNAKNSPKLLETEEILALSSSQRFVSPHAEKLKKLFPHLAIEYALPDLKTVCSFLFAQTPSNAIKNLDCKVLYLTKP